MAATGLAGRLRRLLPPSRARVPAGPPLGEVAAASIAGRLQPYIGELPLNPRQPSRYADRYRDEGHALQIYRDTLRDERCQAALDQRLDAAIARPWTVEPGGDTPGRPRRGGRPRPPARGHRLRRRQPPAPARGLVRLRHRRGALGPRR